MYSIKKRRALGNRIWLIVGKTYSLSNKCSHDCNCCPIYTGVLIEFTKPLSATFKLVYPASGIITIRLDDERFVFKEIEPPISPTLAKQYARGLCNYIPEDCAGIIERFLTSMAGEGPFRYSLRTIES